MRISELLKDLRLETSIGIDHDVTGLSCDSRKVDQGYLFFSFKGFNEDGKKYIPEAVEKGCVAVVASGKTGFEDLVPHIYTENPRKAYALAVKVYFNSPADPLYLTGITGTNGKTSTAYLIHQFFMAAGINSGEIGTLGYAIKDQWYPGKLTTPDPLILHGIFQEFKNAGITHAVMEVSSHALELHRVEGLEYNRAIFTNLSRDHLDFHSSMDTYAAVKSRLFGMLKTDGLALINQDDSYAGIMEKTTGNRELMRYSFINKSADFFWKTIKISPEGIRGKLQTPQGLLNLKTPLTGRFNAYNILAAVGAVFNIVDSDVIIQVLKHVKPVPGRYEKIIFPGKPMVVVDYAHTPDAMENILAALKIEKNIHGKLIVVFGCGGDRDASKRPMMGHVAELYGDMVFLTSDNPRFEDPIRIIEMAKEGITNHTRLTVEPDRKEAIRLALNNANENDVVAILGKGHETYQEIKGVRYPFDDRQIVKEILSE